MLLFGFFAFVLTVVGVVFLIRSVLAAGLGAPALATITLIVLLFVGALGYLVYLVQGD